MILLYILCNVVYLCALPLDGSPNGTTVLARGIQFASEDRVATAVMEQMFGAPVIAYGIRHNSPASGATTA